MSLGREEPALSKQRRAVMLTAIYPVMAHSTAQEDKRLTTGKSVSPTRKISQ